MLADPYALSDQRIKHLEMIQAVITRVGNDSFLVKGWAVTVSGVFLGFAVNSKEPGLALVSVLPALLFWSLDTYYLKSERLFRVFYDRVRTGGAGVVPFGMNATGKPFLDTLVTDDERATRSYWKTAVRPTLRYLYGGLVLAAFLIAAVGPRAPAEKHPSAHGCTQLVDEAVQHC